MQEAESLRFEFPYPAFIDFVERHGIDEVQLFATAPYSAQQIGCLQYTDVLRYRLPGHVEVFAKRAEGLPVFLTQQIEQLSARWVAQRFENYVVGHRFAHLRKPYMQAFTCMSSLIVNQVLEPRIPMRRDGAR